MILLNITGPHETKIKYWTAIVRYINFRELNTFDESPLMHRSRINLNGIQHKNMTQINSNKNNKCCSSKGIKWWDHFFYKKVSKHSYFQHQVCACIKAFSILANIWYNETVKSIWAWICCQLNQLIVIYAFHQSPAKIEKRFFFKLIAFKNHHLILFIKQKWTNHW